MSINLFFFMVFLISPATVTYIFLLIFKGKDRHCTVARQINNSLIMNTYFSSL